MFINRVLQHSSDEETIALTFTTDLELPMVRKIEQAIGQRIPVAELPENLVIDSEPKESKKKIKTTKAPDVIEEKGAAFHEKKASNSKNYNYGSGLKAKMNNKKKHS